MNRFTMSGRLCPKGWFVLPIVAAAALGFCGTVTAAPAAHASPTRHYVDCGATGGTGDGSASSPWSTLAAVNERTFEPGDVLAFAAGSTCKGTLSPRGSGSATAPITVTRYGTGSLPVIDGNGAADALTLTDQDHWTIRDIEVINPGTQDNITARTGIHVTADDGAAHHGIHITHVAVDRTAGSGVKSTGGTYSAGIEFGCTGDNTTINDSDVTDSTISDTGGGGIKLRVGSSPTVTAPHGRHVKATHNTLKDVGGDGIIIEFAVSPLIEHNTADRLGYGAYPWTGGNFAGMWFATDIGTSVAQYNTVRNSKITYDSEGFDCDGGMVGTCLIQHNRTVNNNGLFLDCNGCFDGGKARDVVRYNVAINDCNVHIAESSSSPNAVYGNVFYCPGRKASFYQPGATDATVDFEHNVVVAAPGSTMPSGPVFTYRDNIWKGVTPPPAGDAVSSPGVTPAERH